ALPIYTLTAASLPLPDLERIIFGRGRLANPLMYSALVPLLLSFAAIARKSLRPVVAGVSIGFAAMLAYAAWSGAPALAWLPFKALALPWLTVHAFICLFIGRAMLRREEGARPRSGERSPYATSSSASGSSRATTER